MTVQALSVKSPKYKYTLKVVNPTRKGTYLLCKLLISRTFSSIADARSVISTAAESEITNFGYILPGHGWKGRQEVLYSDEDITEMYTTYGTKSDILLWCHGGAEEESSATRKKPRKRSHSPGNESGLSTAQRSKRSCAGTLSEIEDIIIKLKEKYGNQYSTEKLNAWAHMIHMGKHESLETPPDLPYFRGKSRCNPQVLSTTPAETGRPMLPGKRINLRSECMDQLNKWHGLLEKGAITQTQYDEFQAKILSDIADL